MKLEKLKKNYIKNILVIIVFCCILLLAQVYFFKTYAIYQISENKNVLNGSVQDPGDIYFAYYIDNEISNEMPTQNSGYTLDTTNSFCNNGVTLSWDEGVWSLTTDFRDYSSENNSRTKCNLYFIENTNVINTVLGNLSLNTSTPEYAKSSCSSGCETTLSGIFATSDNNGTSYYYRGSVVNNYVYFANYYWRIIRINGNGSIRLIYDGTYAHENGDISTDRRYTTSKFNSVYNDNMYAGYMYKSGAIHGFDTSSDIKVVLDEFYTTKLASYESYFDIDAGFCGDRTVVNNAPDVGLGTTPTYYSGYLRVIESVPTLICSDENDLYTVAAASQGNKALTYPIGLVSIDEVMFAGHGGGFFNGNSNYQETNGSSYITIGEKIWTMTPAGYYNPWGTAVSIGINMFAINANGALDENYLNSEHTIKPVINLKSTVKITGSGTIADPYIIQ